MKLLINYVKVVKFSIMVNNAATNVLFQRQIRRKCIYSGFSRRQKNFNWIVAEYKKNYYFKKGRIWQLASRVNKFKPISQTKYSMELLNLKDYLFCIWI